MKILSCFVKHTSSYVLLQYCEYLELVMLFKTVNLIPTPRLDTKILAQPPRGISGACLDEQLCLIGNFFFHAKSGEIEPFSRDCESLRLVLVLYCFINGFVRFFALYECITIALALIASMCAHIYGGL